MLLIQFSPGTALNTLDEAQLATLSKGKMEGGDLCNLVTKVIILNFNSYSCICFFFFYFIIFSFFFYFCLLLFL